MAAEALGLGPVAWYCENDVHASKLLAVRLPGIANHGDLKTVEWERVEPVDVVVAGYPCQGESLAGKRKGEDDDRWIWPWIACALRVLRPRLILAENVSAHLSLGFGRVLNDLAAAGFDAEWRTLRASDVGACHQRDRIFWAAWPTADTVCHQPERLGGSGQLVKSQRERERARLRNGNGFGMPLGVAVRTLPTPTVGDAASSRNSTANRSRTPPTGLHKGDTLTDALSRWGVYADAIARHAEVFGRPAPSPTDDDGRLSPAFVEFMMMLPEGWVTDLDLPRTAQLRLLGNAVVPRQATVAWGSLLGVDLPACPPARLPACRRHAHGTARALGADPTSPQPSDASDFRRQRSGSAR